MMTAILNLLMRSDREDGYLKNVQIPLIPKYLRYTDMEDRRTNYVLSSTL